MDNPTHSPSSATVPARAGNEAEPARADIMIRRTTVATVVVLAAVAAIISYGHMHTLALLHGEQRWTAALLPLSVDGMIIAASLALLSDSRHGRRGVLPWTLLVIASGASLAANVAAAHPALVSRIISAWPPFALIGAYEMLMRQIRHSVAAGRARQVPQGQSVTALHSRMSRRSDSGAPREIKAPVVVTRLPVSGDVSRRRPAAERRQREAWQWALDHRLPDGELPTGEAIADVFQRSARWGRLVKSAGLSGRFNHTSGQQAA